MEYTDSFILFYRNLWIHVASPPHTNLFSGAHYLFEEFNKINTYVTTLIVDCTY